MSEQIREALSNLHSSKTPDEALTLVEEVGRTCQDQAFSDKDEGYITTLLVSDDKGLVAFLKSSVVSDQLKDAKAKGLQILTGWFEKAPAQLMPHAATVKDVSSQLVFRDKASKVRCAALGLLSKVLESGQGTHQLDVPNLLHRFFILLSQPSKMTPTVKVEVLCVLGVIAQHHPAAALPYSDKLLSLYLGELSQLKTAGDGKERTTFAGCLQGLAGYLHNFGTSFDEDPDKCFLLFSYVKKALVPSAQATRYDVPRAGLILVSRHASLFGRLLLDEHRPLYRQLCGWSCHGNREMKALGTAALEAFLREVAAALADGEGRDDCLDIFEFFIREFQATLRSETNTYDLAAALKGYGLLALPCKRYLKEADVLFMLGDVLLRSEHVFQSVSSPAVLEDSLPLLTSFQEALASILRCAHQVPESQLLVVEKLCVLQMEHFPLVAPGLQARYCRSLLLLLLACHPLAPASLAHVVYQGLVRTCSHPIVADVEASEEEDDGTAPGGRLRKITYRHYNFLWGFLLRAVTVKELNDLQVSLEARHAFVADVYDAMLSAVLSMISKLNLCVKRSSAEAETAADMSDPTCGVDAECPKDFNIFINLVDFFRDNFLGKHFEFFPKWAFVLIKKFVEYSTRYPLVSGFYKALAVCFQICDKSSYFDGSSPSSGGGEEVRRCLCLVSSCVREALGRLQQFRDDLLASCLELVLRAPRSVVRQHAPALVPALQVALGQGLSFLPLARSALDALRLWEQWLAPEVVDACFRQVLPRLCPYLSLGAQADLLASDPAEKTKRPRPRGPHKIPLKVLYQKKVEHSKAHASELESLRRDILAFLGGLAGERRAFLLADLEADTLAAALTWDPETHEHLPFALPFPDAKLDVALDVFLPRVVELARFGGERQTKVAGCELLHALGLYTVGMGVQNTERRAKRPMVHLYRHLFPELLHLACDADQVAQNLFRPLVLQLMHWFSSRSTRGSQESATIVECLWDTVTQPQETTLRDFAAQCLKEFVAWSIRQSSPKELEKSPVNVQSVLRRLGSYCRHPNAFKRVGAALVFNNIYVLLREEEALVDTFILETLAYFVDSLKLAHADERTVGSQELCGRALDNVLRIVSAKSSLLSSPNRKRRWPCELGSSQGVTLSVAVEWLLTQASCLQSDCRRKCMQLFWSLVPRLPGAPSHAAFMAGLLKANGVSFFVDRWEAGVLPAAGGSLGSVAGVRKFCDRLLGLVECYAWVLQQRLLEPPVLFQVPGRPSAIFPMITTFLEQLALCNDVHEVVGREDDGPLSTPTEQAAFSLARCSLTVRLFHFLTVWMEAAPESMASFADPFWETEAFWKCCVLCVLLPSEAGYDLADLEVANELPHEMLRFLRQVSRTCPALLSSGFAPALAALVAERPECGLEQVLRLRLDDLALSSQEGGGLLRLTGLVSGYCLLAQLGMVEAGLEERAQAPVEAVARLLAAPAGTPTPLVRELCLRLLQLGTALGAGAAEVLQSLEPTRAWSVMGDQLCQLLVDNAGTFVPALLARGDRAPATLTQVLSWLLRDRQLASRHGRSLSSAVMEQWAVLARLFEEGSPQAVVNAAVPVLEKLLLLAPEVSSAASPHFENLFTLFLKLLQRPGAALVDKALVLGLLPAFARDTRPSTCDRLREVLEELVLQHFPPEVSQLAPGDPQLLCYAQAMRRLLAGLEGSGGSPLLLDLVLRVLCRDQGPHFLEPELQRALRRTMPRCSEARQQELLRTTYLCAANRALSTSARLGITSRLLPQLMQHASKPALRQFFVGNIAAIMDTVASKMRAGGSEGELASKILALSCLELLYSCSTRDDVSGQQSALNSAFCRARGLANPVGNELTREATRHANMLKKERGELGAAGSEAGVALWRRLRCTAYNAIAAIISCTQVEEQFYDVFLFQEKPEKGEFIWNNITDEEKVYRFPLETEAPSRRRRQVVGVAEEAPGAEGSPSGRSLASLQGSSLAQEASQYSLSSSMAFWGPGEEQRKAAGPSAESKVEEEEEEASSKVRRLQVLELEEDELNGHPCMATLCSLLGHMARTHPGSTHHQEAGSIPVVPKWLSTITAAMAAEHTRPNALRFLCRAIVNCAEVLKVYRHHLVPVMLAIFDHPQGLVQELDAFAVDLIVTVLTWTADLDAKEGALGVGRQAQHVLEFLVARCGHPRREILRRQLELVNAWVDVWKRELRFPHGIVLQQIEDFVLSTKDEKAVLLFGIFVTHDLVTFDTADHSLDRILERLPRLLASKHRVCYTAVADVVGLTLRKMNEGVAGVQASFQGAVEGELTALLRAGQRDQYLLALLHICRLYQPLATRFVESALLQLPRALASFRVAILEVVSLACGQLEEPLQKLQGLGFLDLLAHGDEATQKASLEICARLPGVATVDDWRCLLPSVCRLQGHTSGSCRGLVYDICMRLYTKHRGDPAAGDLAEQAKRVLLLGLGDTDMPLRLLVSNFWCQESQLPRATRERLVSLLGEVYLPDTEEHFLSSATFLLLELSSHSPDYGRKLFPQPLADCHFVDYAVTGSWRRRHAAMTPLFAETLSLSQTQSSSSSVSSDAPSQRLRATQRSLQFTPTQHEGSREAAAYSWLTQSTHPVAVGGPPSESRPPALALLQLASGEASSPLGQQAWSERAQKLQLLRRRFLRDEDQVRQLHMRREVRLQEARKKLEAERRVRREAEVTLYRSYRLGDFPDIEITHAALIAPLQALAQQDQQVAQTLLSAVVASVLRDSQRDPEAASAELLRGRLQGALAAMLEGSVRCFPPLVAFVQEAVFQSATDLRLPVSAISRASISSGHQSLGILLLEEMERAETDSSSAKAPPAKRSKVDGDVPSHTWVHLAELYKSLGDYDAVRASLSLCESLGPEAKQALEHEARGDYLQARHIYRQLAASGPGDRSGPTWDDAVLECCCLLGEWKELQDEVEARLGGPSALEALWDGAYRQEHYLPLYVKAGTKRTLEEGGAKGSFPAVVRQWMEDSRRKRVLEEECCQELALLCLAQGDTCRADYYVHCLTEHFLQDWSSLSVLTPTLIESKLEGLLPLTDLIQYVRQGSSCSSAPAGPEEEAPSRLLSGWRDRLPSNADSVLLWNEVVASRCFFIKSLGHPVAREKALLLNAFATAMLQQENVPTALRCIAQVEKMRLGRELDGWSHWEYVEAYCALLRKASGNEPLAKQLAAHVRMLEKLEAVAGEGPAPNDPAQSVKYRTLKGQLMSGLSSILGAGAHMTAEQGAAVKLSGGSDRAISEQSTADEALHQHLAAIAEPAVPSELAAEAHVSLALFCSSALQAAETGDAASCLSRLGDCPRLMVDSVLAAMRLGHGRAPDMFPRLLQLLQRHPSCSNAFVAQCPRVPCWMFLRWINQVLALLDKQVGPCLFDLVDSVARHYPNALVYPFRVSSSAYTFECPETQSACRAFVGRLQQSMNEVPLVNDFIAALELLQFPDIVFKDWCESVKDALGEKQGPASLRELFKRIASQLQGWSRDSPGQASPSRIHRHFSDTMRKKVTEAFGSQGEKLVGMTPKGFQEQYRQIMRGYKPQAPTVLKDISPWLSRFSSLNQQHSLEIPGQYTGRCRPMPEYHVKIFGFDEAVRVLPSKQRPCRITIRGDDEKEHRFLVKTGEDLRQDDRIERLFEVMNDLLREDPVCRTRHLHIVTYSVVPLTDRVGLIQWLDNTVVLEEFLSQGLTSEQLANIQKVEGSYKLHTGDDYMKAYEMPSCQQAATARYHSCLRPSSRQALRQALLGLSSCPEAFFALRSRFVASHATLSIAHWVLGIGDRHLGNFLVDTHSGLEVGIDFGYAFGVATQFLPVPELMPFRLTPQYVALTEPFDKAGGPLACAMHYALHALREGARRLLDMMDVFVQEPTIDWLRFAKRQSLQAKQQKGPGGKALDWYPRQKVDVVRQKLEGCHPSYIMRDELRLGRGHQQTSLGSMERLCLGAQGPQGAVRRRLAAIRKLSPQQQVECLIEQATDPAILGLTWIGWKPWR